MLVEDALHGVEVVVDGHQAVRCGRGGDARRVGGPEGQRSAARSDEEGVAVSVVAALELQDLLAAGGGAQAGSGHGRLGARVHEAHHLAAGDALGDEPRHLELAPGRRAEGRPRVHGLVEGSAHLLVAVAEDERAVGAHEVHVLVPVLVPDERALTAHEVRGRSAHALVGTDGAVHAAGDELTGGCEDLFAPGEVEAGLVHGRSLVSAGEPGAGTRRRPEGARCRAAGSALLELREGVGEGAGVGLREAHDPREARVLGRQLGVRGLSDGDRHHPRRVGRSQPDAHR